MRGLPAEPSPHARGRTREASPGRVIVIVCALARHEALWALLVKNRSATRLALDLELETTRPDQDFEDFSARRNAAPRRDSEGDPSQSFPTAGVDPRAGAIALTERDRGLASDARSRGDARGLHLDRDESTLIVREQVELAPRSAQSARFDPYSAAMQRARYQVLADEAEFGGRGRATEDEE